VAEKLAEIHNVSLELIAEKTSTNATELFRLPNSSPEPVEG
jgi:Tat protein secretion system quality control protein TatD with DNase activity